MSCEGRDNTKVVEGYIPVTGGNIWYKIVGSSRKKIPLLVLHVALVHLMIALSSLRP
jgi:hypothetical protein